MQIFTTVQELQKGMAPLRQLQKIIGFVPTMGALHKGHISLVEKALRESDFVVCSIFVNPIQFNSKEDLEHYPRTLDNDYKVLESAGCHAVFVPSVEEMYPAAISEKYDFKELETVMEGKFRPGHFNGVAIVVKRLFDIVQPDKAFFGEKDYQQLAIIKQLVKEAELPVKIIPCPIMREPDGLAMSSRNLRLTQKERLAAPFIYNTLCRSVEMSQSHNSDEVQNFVIRSFESNPIFKLEYFELVDDTTLQPILNFSEGQGAVGCIAAYLGKVRLIDVMRFR